MEKYTKKYKKSVHKLVWIKKKSYLCSGLVITKQVVWNIQSKK